MDRFHGKIGFAIYEETALSTWTPTFEEREYSGDVLRNNNRYVDNATINGNLVINNQISVIADPYINQHFPSIRYVEWKGYKWKVTYVEDHYPRLILSLGDVYNGE